MNMFKKKQSTGAHNKPYSKNCATCGQTFVAKHPNRWNCDICKNNPNKRKFVT